MRRWTKVGGEHPDRWITADGRFEIIRSRTRYNIRPRPVTVTKIVLRDRSTGTRDEGFRTLRDAKAAAEEILDREARVDF